MTLTVHTYPVGDLIEHTLIGDECVCGPTTHAAKKPDGSMGWSVEHHSLDGREKRE